VTRLVLPLAEIPACISESVKTCLAAHGLSLSEPVLVELGNNAAQALFSIDQADHGEPEDGVDVDVDATDVFYRAQYGQEPRK
jgi:hypothetical protein